MAFHRGGAAVYTIGSDVYRVPKAAGAKSGDRGGGEASGWRAARRVHNAAGQPGEGKPGAAMRVSEAAGTPVVRRRCEGRSIATCTWRWRRRVRRSSACRRWTMRTQSRWRLTKQRKDWWTAHWKKKWPQSWPTFYKWP